MWLARVQRFNFAVFSKGPPATNRGSPEERGEGTRLSVPSTFQRAPPRVAVSFLGPLSENIPLDPLGLREKKGALARPQKEDLRLRLKLGAGQKPSTGR
jgi:hypothetical protein